MRPGDAFTFKRARHALGSRLSYLGTSWLSTYFEPPLPVALAIEPTTSCNLRCPECPSGLRSFTRPTGNLNRELLIKVLNEVATHCGYLTFYFQGEPFLHPDFTSMVREAADRKIFTVTSTNAHFINEQMSEEICRSGLGKLIVSLDGTTSSSYEKYRIGGDIEKVFSALSHLSAARKRVGSGPVINVQFLITKHNETEVLEAKANFKKWGADSITFKTVQVYDPSDPNDLVPQTEVFSRYRRDKEGKLRLNNDWRNHCWKLWSSAVITWDGKVVPCCFDKDAKYIMGDLNTSTFREIWTSEPYRVFRKQLHAGRATIDICRNCSEGSHIEPLV